MTARITVAVCVPLGLDPAPVKQRIEAAGGGAVECHFDRTLLPPPRFVADHKGADGFVRDPEAEQRWRALLARADVALGIPGDSPEGLRDLLALAPRLQWVQGTAAGTGEQVMRAGLRDDVLGRVRFTSTAGIHAVPLAEFALFGLLAFAKDLDVLAELDRSRTWRTRWPMQALRGTSVLVLGLGGVGREVARLAAAFGCRVTAVRRQSNGALPEGVAALARLSDLDELLPAADSVVVTLPGTAQTAGLLDGRRLALLPPHAVVVNVGRGSVLDSAALAARLDSGGLRGAVLDVADEEPLPATSPLWGRPNVIISPHTAALSVDEDARIVELFIDNLRRFVDGIPLVNLVDPAVGY